MQVLYRFLLLLVLSLCGVASAHPMPSSLVLMDIHAQDVGMELQLPLMHMGYTMHANLLGDPDGVLKAHEQDFRKYLPQHIKVTSPTGQPWQVQVDGLEVKPAEQTQTGTEPIRNWWRT